MTASADKSARFAHAVKERNVQATMWAAIIVVVLNPLFGVLDRFQIPDHANTLLVIRLMLEAVAIVVFVLCWRVRDFVAAHDTTISLSMMILVAWSIEVMVFLHLGYSSPYYAGINLVVITTGYLFLVTSRTAALFHLLVFVPFITPAITGAVAITDGLIFLTHNLFLVSTIFIVFISQRFRYQLELREFEGRTALEETTSSLETALSKLKELDQAKNQFFNNITHELRTPLTMILAPVESIRTGEMGPLNPEQSAGLEVIWNSGLRLLKLINDLLDLAKMEEKFLYLQLEETNLEPMVGDVVAHAQPLAKRKNITLSLKIGSPCPELHVDVVKLERVLINLLSNALKFTEPGGNVVVTLDGDDVSSVLSVGDDGPGIDPDHLTTIFERFSQADASITRRFGGTGIGLAFAKSIVELHGGSIEVDSQVGRGSTFFVRLPRGRDHIDAAIIDRRHKRYEGSTQRRRADDRGPREWAARLVDQAEYRFSSIEDATDRRRVKRGVKPQGGATSVLVVEDNLDVAQFIVMLLQGSHTVFVANDGQEGLELAREKVPDVIVSDYMMPRMDGLSMVAALKGRKQTAEIPVIMLTAKSQAQDRFKARSVGVDIYLSKPFSSQELRASVAQLLAKRGRQATSLLDANMRSLEIVSAGLAHEINNPLSYIRNAATVISEGIATISKLDLSGSHDERGRPVDRWFEKLERMSGLIDVGVQRIEKVVELMTRYAREGYPKVPTPTEVDAAVVDLSQLVVPKDGYGVSVELDLQAPGCRVLCVAEELHQAITNLLQNALDSVGNEGKVVIATRIVDEMLWVDVVDTGPGIDAETQKRLFVPFYTTKQPGSGMGLGLTMTRKVVESCGGTIEVISAPGEGTTFRVRLPISNTIGSFDGGNGVGVLERDADQAENANVEALDDRS